MKVIKPIEITEPLLISTNVPEDDHAEWNSETDYAVGDRVIHEHVVWECLQTPNINHTPGGNATYWAQVSATNRWMMFDQEVSSQTTFDASGGPLSVVVAPGIVNSLALLNLEGASLTVTVQDGLGGPVIYSYESALDGTLVTDWYDYFFEPFDQLTEVVLTDLPVYGSAHVTVEIAGGGMVKCGGLVFGTAQHLGDTQRGSNIGIIDYSRKDTSETGVTTFVRRRFSKRMSGRFEVEKTRLNKVHRVLSELRATPCVWIGSDAAGFQSQTVFGFYRDFSIEVTYPTLAYCSIEIEGLI